MLEAEHRVPKAWVRHLKPGREVRAASRGGSGAGHESRGAARRVEG